jgi:hypothetical protein
MPGQRKQLNNNGQSDKPQSKALHRLRNSSQKIYFSYHWRLQRHIPGVETQQTRKQTTQRTMVDSRTNDTP